MKLTITIVCEPKKGAADKLQAAIWDAVTKHAKKNEHLNIDTTFDYQDGKETV